MGFFVLKIVIKYLAFWFAYEWDACFGCRE